MYVVLYLDKDKLKDKNDTKCSEDPKCKDQRNNNDGTLEVLKVYYW